LEREFWNTGTRIYSGYWMGLTGDLVNCVSQNFENIRVQDFLAELFISSVSFMSLCVCPISSMF